MRLDTRLDEVKSVKQVIERDIRNEYAGIIERLKSAEGVKTAVLSHDLSEVQQDITRIDSAINSGEFAKNLVLNNLLTSTSSKTLHIMGLLSDGGVHAHIKHIFALIQIANQSPHIETIWLHVFLDGRDTPPKSALSYLDQLNNLLNNCKKVRVATVGGRYYAMDRDNRYNRIKLAYDAIVNADSPMTANDAITALENSYAIEELDEFVQPCVIGNYHGMNNGDSVIYANFRSDRAIELTNAIVNREFNEFSRKPLLLSNYVTMTEYDRKFNLTPLFPPITISNTIGEYIAKQGLSQLRIAETEKYPHVTYFFNGGRKQPFVNEERILIDSPRDVKTYDLKPEMSLPEVSQQLVNAIEQNCFDFIITNFANGDMVGHSGNFLATIKAVEALDEAVYQCVSAMQKIGGETLIIADHGNCEQMFDLNVNQPHTQHTTNLVPFIYIGRPASIINGGSLADVAPTLLTMAGLDIPPEMTGKCLIKFNQ